MLLYYECKNFSYEIRIYSLFRRRKYILIFVCNVDILNRDIIFVNIVNIYITYNKIYKINEVTIFFLI